MSLIKYIRNHHLAKTFLNKYTNLNNFSLLSEYLYHHIYAERAANFPVKILKVRDNCVTHINVISILD